MNFKSHVNYAIEKLESVGGDCDVHYEPGCGVLPPRKLIDEIARDMSSVTTKDGMLARMTVSLVSIHSQWARWGLNTFDLTASLTAGLMMTTPTSERGFPRMPYPAFFIRIPVGFLPFWTRERAAPQWIEGMLVCRLKLANSSPAAEVLHLQLLGPGVGMNGEKERTLSLLLTERNLGSPAEFTKMDEHLWDEPIVVESEAVGDPNDYVETTNRDEITKRLAVRLLANLCSWLESIGGLVGRRPSNAPKSGRSDSGDWDTLENRGRIAQWIVGQEVKLTSELIAAAKEFVVGLGEGKKAGWRLRAQHTVRGHIRHQACGPHHTERKVIWIAPFTRGPANGDVVAHIYKAQESGVK